VRPGECTIFNGDGTSSPSTTLWFKLLPDTEFIENICDNEKDVERIKTARGDGR
jgi:hypothetical protein